MATTPETPVLVDGYDAAFWNQSYGYVRDAVIAHLDSCIREDDVAEEAIVEDAIMRAGARLQRMTELLRDMANTDGWAAGWMQRRAIELLEAEGVR